MKITINNKGKKESFNLIEKWEDVTLEKWLKLIEIKTDKKALEAIENISTLSNIPKDLIKFYPYIPLLFHKGKFFPLDPVKS